MPRTTQCTNCGVVLNLPEQAIGRRLKCPKCGAKFQAGEPSGNSSSIAPGLPTASPDSSQLIPRSRGNASSIAPGLPSGPDSSQEIPRGRSDDALPVAAGDLRETFELPLLGEASGPSPGSKPTASDALALFEEPRTKRRVGAAEARAKARRCPTCGGGVPPGMSLCPSCGLDLETGRHVSLDDDLTPPPPPRPSGPPLSVAIVGGLCLLGAVAATLTSISKWMFWQHPEWKWFIPLGVFGAYAAVQFLRGKTARLLLVALTLTAAIDVVALIAMPIVYANMETTVVETDDPNSDGEAIQSVADRLDQRSITWGVVLLIGYAGVATFLCSPPVRRHLRQH